MAGRKILLVEGLDDVRVLSTICEAHRVPDEFKITGCEDVERLLESLPSRLRAVEEGDILGILIDADTDLSARWRSLRNRFIEVGYLSGNVPGEPESGGTIMEPPTGARLPRVGIWLMPNNETGGILEDFLAYLVPANSPLFSHAKSSVSTIPEGEQRFKDAARSKALIHTWLAWQKEPGRPLGTAITAKFLDPSVPQVDALVSWLKRLFLS